MDKHLKEMMELLEEQQPQGKTAHENSNVVAHFSPRTPEEAEATRSPSSRPARSMK